MDMNKRKELELLALNIRRQTMFEIATLGVGHIGGTLSIAEVLAVLYGEVMHYRPDDLQWKERDQLVLSKGHCGPALYAVLALKGFFPMEQLATLNKPGTILPSHADRLKTPGIDATTGSLGQGLGVACGIALGNKMNGIGSYTYAIMGDGECQEGQIWESMLFAAHRKLNNLIGFVDFNRQQADSWTDQVCSLGDMHAKCEAFGWYTQDVDGHDVEQIYDAICRAQAQSEKPSMIILHTNKGQGLTKYQDKYGYHNGNVSMDDLQAFNLEFDACEKEILAKEEN